MAPGLSERALAWGRVLRLSLAPSAAADAVAGALLGRGAWIGGGQVLVQAIGALAVYHGGMALNDWHDRSTDRETRPERPLPAGALRPAAVAATGFGLSALGPLLVAAVSVPGALVLAAVAALSLAYNLGLRRPWIGPLLLGLCRAGNLAAGAVTAGGLAASHPLFSWGIPALGYGIYVGWLSRAARHEDAPQTPAHRRAAGVALGGAALLLGLLPLVRWPLGGALRCVTAALGSGWAAVGLGRIARRAREGSVPIAAAVGAGLRRLLVATAALAWTVDDPAAGPVALGILAGYPLSHALRRVFPPS